jgi:hypothetical protein
VRTNGEVEFMTSTRRRRRCVALAVGFVLAILVVGACSDDDDTAGEENSTSTTEAPATTTTTQPPGTDPAEVQPYIEDLIVQLDEITDEIVRDPSVALEADAPLLAELEEIHAPGEAYDARLSTYRRNAENGLRLEPLNADHVSTSTLSGPLTTIDENTIEGPLCTLNTYRALNAAGQLVEVKDRLAHPGMVTASRVDGTWKIQRIDEDDTQVCEVEAT